MYGSLCVLVLVVCVPGLYSQMMADPGMQGPGFASTGFGVSMEDQMKLNARCARKCKTESCYLSDKSDCRNFIVCTQIQGASNDTWSYTGTVQKCAFGTFWGGFQKQKKVTCDLPNNVFCNIDYCQGRARGEKFDHVDGNCKTYWECGTKGPVPKCCRDGTRYDYSIHDCVDDFEGSCRDACPIKRDACLTPGQRTEYFEDGNCRTYWDCEDQRPHPVCCPEGQGYTRNGGCVKMPECQDRCPRQYEPDNCLTAEVYALDDPYCRTFMKCNSMEGDERWCCPRNTHFNPNTLNCVETTANFNSSCLDECPQHFAEVCHLKRGADPSTYIVDNHGHEIVMACAPGTLFNETLCACASIIKNAPDNSCSMELDIDFDAPNWVRLGSQKKADIAQIGDIKAGPSLNNKRSYKFDGGLFFRAPFFKSGYDTFYINIIYQADNVPGKQVMLTNCLVMDLQTPSLELYLENGMIYLTLITDEILTNMTEPVMAAVPFSPNVWNKFTAIYDGNMVRVVNEGSEAPNVQELSMSGTVVVAHEGLDIGGCWIDRNLNQGFQGSVSKLQFSKCLKNSWVKAFQDAISVPLV